MVYTFCIVEYEAMKLLRRNNDRREDRLKRVRTKNFRKKEEEVEVTTVYYSIPLYATVYHSIPFSRWSMQRAVRRQDRWLQSCIA